MTDEEDTPAETGKTILGRGGNFFVEKYGNSILARTVAGYLLADAPLGIVAERIKRNREIVFFDELAKGADVSEEVIKSNEFVHRCLITVEAAARTHRKEKIEMFARLLRGSAAEDYSNDSANEAYEKSLRALDALTLQDFALLTHFEDKTATNSQRFECEPEDVNILGERISGPEVADHLSRISSTGLLRSLPGATIDSVGNARTSWRLTNLYYELMKLVTEEKVAE